MSALLGLPIIWQPDDYIFFKKCGEITISPDIQNIGFNCLFCAGICLQSDTFLQHLQEQHKEEVFKLYEQQNTNSNNSLINLNANIISSPQADNCETKDNCLNLNNLLNTEEISSRPLNDLNLMYDLENNDLLTLNYTTNQDFENLITLNTLENLTNNTLTINSPLTTNETPSIIKQSTSSNVISASVDYFKNCLPDDNECEIGDGEDSGIILVQSPCNSDCAGFSDCMSFTEDSCSKSPNSSNDNCISSKIEFSEEHIELKSPINNNSGASKSSKQKYLKTTAMSKALDNKPIIEYLLEIYKKNEKLWNPQHPAYKYNAHRTIFNELSQPLLHDMKYSLTGEEIFGIINQLRGRYRRELKKFEVRKGKHKTRLWYFDKMSFLRPIIEEKRKERNDKEKAITDGEKVKENDLTQRQMLSCLLDLYRQQECLWDTQNPEYLLCNKEEIFKKISEELKEKLNVNLKANECMNEIQKLRIRYRKELRVLHKLKGLYLPKLWCFDEMEFLRTQMQEKINKNLKKPNSTLSQRKLEFLKALEIKFDNLDEQLKFIEIYYNFNSLWDVQHADYRSSNYRRKTLNEMLEKLNFLYGKDQKYNLAQLEKTIYLLHKQFSQEKLKHLIDNNKNQTHSMPSILYEKLKQFLTNNVGPFRCDSCQHLLKTYDQFQMHKSKHDGTLPFICSLCGKGFQMPGNLTIHIRRHRRDFPYSCEICKKSFATSTEVSIHMRSHTGERPYACEWCHKTFKTWSFCDLHRRTHLNQSNFLCPICDKTFYERNRFTDHMNIHLNIRKHQCDQCIKSFTTLGNLKKHLNLIHATGKLYKCHTCDKRFTQFASFKRHETLEHENGERN